MNVNVFQFFVCRHSGKRRPNYSAKPIKFNVRLRVDSLVGCSRPITYVVIYIHMYIHMLLCPYSYICMCMHECAQIPMSIFISYVVRKRLYFMSALLEHTVMHILVHVCSMLCACRRNHRYIWYVCMYYISVFTLALGSLGCQ